MKVFECVTIFMALSLAVGCSSTAQSITASAAGKNLDLSGYVMLGQVETADSETAAPNGKMILGRVSYRSRRVAIPADQKVPTTGCFKSTRTKSLLGTEETIIEYDFTAGSETEAKAASEKLEAMAQQNGAAE